MATSTDLRSAIEEVQQQLPGEEAPAEGELAVGGGDWATRLERRVGSLPWWVISAATHAVLFLMIALLATTVAAPVVDEVVISTDVIKQKPPEYDPEKKRDVFRSTKDVRAADDSIVDNPVVSLDKNAEQSDHFETDNNSDKGTARGSEDAISDIPLGGTGVVGTMGVGGGGMAGCFGYRDGGGRKKAVGRFGGSQATESSVEAALRWLARHQESDGHWDCGKYEGTEKQNGDTGVTGLALLAFLGAGYTEKSGQFADNVKRAEDWLVKQQKPNGSINAPGSSRLGYNHAIAGLALAEAYGMGKNPELGKVAQKAVEYSIKEHQCPYSGWRYGPKESPDTSVTGWFVMQLKSSKIAGLQVDGTGFQGATTWLDKVTGKDGGCGYTGASHDSCMTAVGMVCRQFMGTPSNDPLLESAAGLLGKALPEWKDARGHAKEKGFYYYYYGTLAMFQMGGAHWENWNKSLKPMLVNNQCKGPLPLSAGAEDKDGSWDEESWIDKYGGRVMTTALGALTLEVYYRYLPMYAK